MTYSDNEAEWALRHAVLDRKNFNGSITFNGADVASVHYSLIQTCKKVQLDPAIYYGYLVDTNNVNGTLLLRLDMFSGKLNNRGLLNEKPQHYSIN